MPYKDLKKSREAHRDLMRKKRRGVTLGVTKQGVTSEGVTEYPAIIHALTEKGEMLEKVYQSLKSHNVLGRVYYGYPGLGGVPFDIVGEYLEATGKGG